MAPRSPLVIWEGQEAADKVALTNLHTEPRAFVRLRPIKDPATGAFITDLPGGGRLPFQPNAEAYEISREAWRRAIQAAAGISPLPTDAQRTNQKSGIALEKINNAEAVGSYHFSDNADRSLENGGRQLNELITKVMDTPRAMTMRNPDDTHGSLMVGAQEHMGKFLQGDEPEPGAGNDYLITDRGEFDITISTGPDKDSEREDQNEFADMLIENAPQYQLPQPILLKLLAKAIKLRDLGAIGDQIAEMLDPQDAQGQQLAQTMQQLGEAQKNLAAMQQELQQLKLEKAGKVIDNQFKSQMHAAQLAMDARLAQLDADLKAYIANVQTKSQSETERAKLFQETQVENHHAAHELGLQKDQQGHEKTMAAAAAQTAAVTQASDQAHQQTMATQEPEPDEGSQT